MSDEEKKEGQEPGLREIEPEELRWILIEHERWVASKGTAGKRADLDKANLRGAYLVSAILPEAYIMRSNLQGANLLGAKLQQAHLWLSDLKGANLGGADLRDAMLFEANLNGADLSQANLAKARLQRTTLTGADLRYANLTDAVLLGATPLAGMDLTGTRLPADIAKFEGLANVKEAATKASHLFTILLLGCLYAWLTVGTGFMGEVDDEKLGLPFIYNAYISREGFSIAAPLFLLGIYGYLHIYLQRLWEHLALLPAIFPDNMPLDKKAHPWALIGYVRAHIPKLRALPRPPLGRMQTVIIQAVAYWFTPLTLCMFWWDSLAEGSKWGAAVDGLLTWAGVGLALTFLALAADTLRGEAKPDPKATRWQRIKANASRHPYHLAAFGLALEYLVCLSILNWPA